jgi:uncharacterized repeat protein (TIGR03803 family)
MHIANFSQDFLRQVTKLVGPVMLLFCIATLATAQKESTVHNFKRGTDGAFPDSSLISDSANNLYGTTTEGGDSANCVSGKTVVGCGTVYELTPPGNGVNNWTETILYAFQGGTKDGANPATSLVFDGSGNLYGTTYGGGTSSRGTIFELSPPKATGGVWTESILYSFPLASPTSALVFDSAGNLYGESNTPEVYELSAPTPPATTWTYTTLRKFTSQDGGLNPIGGLTFDNAGHLYGTSSTGGNNTKAGCPVSTCGLVFELEKSTSSTWEEHVVYNFTGENGDGASPQAGVLYRGGILYGTTINGGNGTGDGTVFELSPGTGSWTETTLYEFSPTAGHSPEAGVVFDHAGNLYSTLYYGIDGGGEVFELSPPSETGSPWTFIDLFDTNCGTNGCNIATGLLVNKAGALLGTTMDGGTGKFGVVFDVTP